MQTSPRQRLEECATIDDVVRILQTNKRIIVITGAGISVNCGIPDFRSANGIYNTIDCEALNIPSAELLFDMEFFKIDPYPFYNFSKTFYHHDNKIPSLTHRFISLLEKKKKLCRTYTQNVDGLEKAASITKLIECHGSMHSFRCIKCKKKGDYASIINNLLLHNSIPLCQCSSYMKPDIIFFGEKFPKTMEIQMKKDMLTCDAILVIGTSLKVGGSVVELLKNVDASIPQILINKDPISLSSKISEGFDVTLLGCCDDVIAYLQQELRWKDDVLSIPSNNKVYTCESISNRMYVCSSHHKSNEILIHENLVKTHDEHTLQEPAGSLKSTRKRTRNQFLD